METNLKSKVILPIIFLMNIGIILFIRLDSDFLIETSKIIMYFYIAITICYETLALYDASKRKDSKKLIYSIDIMAILSSISLLLYYSLSI